MERPYEPVSRSKGVSLRSPLTKEPDISPTGSRTPIIPRRKHLLQEAQMSSPHGDLRNARASWLLALGRRMEML